MKKSLLSLFLLFALVLTSCSQKNEEPKNNKQTEEKQENKDEKRKFVDDLGREFELPKVITKVAPAGNPAQVMLHTFEPNKLVGISGKFSKSTEKFITEDMKKLPEFGAFYGKKANLNMEALIKASPQIVIDMGEKKKNIKEDLDKLQEQIKTPVIFIELTLDKMPDAYTKLGELLGNEARGKELSDYIKKTYEEINSNKSKIKEVKKVYYGGGKNGLAANAKGSIHADIIEFIGAENPIIVEKIQGGSGNEIPFEKLLEVKPDIMIFENNDLLKQVKEDETFKTLDAVKNEMIFSTPVGPYNFFGRPPAVNRIIGMKWLGNLVYPDVYKYDIEKEVKEFYKLFYNYELKDEEVKNILNVK